MWLMIADKADVSIWTKHHMILTPPFKEEFMQNW